MIISSKDMSYFNDYETGDRGGLLSMLHYACTIAIVSKTDYTFEQQLHSNLD